MLSFARVLNRTPEGFAAQQPVRSQPSTHQETDFPQITSLGWCLTKAQWGSGCFPCQLVQLADQLSPASLPPRHLGGGGVAIPAPPPGKLSGRYWKLSRVPVRPNLPSVDFSGGDVWSSSGHSPPPGSFRSEWTSRSGRRGGAMSLPTNPTAPHPGTSTYVVVTYMDPLSFDRTPGPRGWPPAAHLPGHEPRGSPRMVFLKAEGTPPPKQDSVQLPVVSGFYIHC